MAQEFLGLRMQNLQGTISIWTRTYREIFKSPLVYLYIHLRLLIENFYKSNELRAGWLQESFHIQHKVLETPLTIFIQSYILGSWIWWYRYKSLEHQNKLTAHLLIFSQITSLLNNKYKYICKACESFHF